MAQRKENSLMSFWKSKVQPSSTKPTGSLSSHRASGSVGAPLSPVRSQSAPRGSTSLATSTSSATVASTPITSSLQAPVPIPTPASPPASSATTAPPQPADTPSSTTAASSTEKPPQPVDTTASAASTADQNPSSTQPSTTSTASLPQDPTAAAVAAYRPPTRARSVWRQGMHKGISLASAYSEEELKSPTSPPSQPAAQPTPSPPKGSSRSAISNLIRVDSLKLPGNSVITSSHVKSVSAAPTIPIQSPPSSRTPSPSAAPAAPAPPAPAAPADPPAPKLIQEAKSSSSERIRLVGTARKTSLVGSSSDAAIDDWDSDASQNDVGYLKNALESFKTQLTLERERREASEQKQAALEQELFGLRKVITLAEVKSEASVTGKSEIGLLLLRLGEQEKEIRELKKLVVSLTAASSDLTSPKELSQSRSITDLISPRPLSSPKTGLVSSKSGDLSKSAILSAKDPVDATPVYDITELAMDKDLVIEEVKDTNKIRILGGTTTKFIDVLTASSFTDSNFREVFLLTMRSISSPLNILNLLIERFNKYNTVPADSDRNALGQKKFVQTRVMHLLKLWVTQYLQQFEDSELQTTLRTFLESQPTNSNIQALLDVLMGKTVINVYEMQAETAPIPLAPSTRPLSPTDQFLGFNPLEISRQLALITHQMFRSILPIEFLTKVWEKKTFDQVGVNLQRLIKRHNRVCNYFAYEIVRHDKLQLRQRALKQVLAIAQSCFELHNYEGLVAIVSCLQSTPVYRLRQTWKAVETSSKHALMWSQLANLVAPEQNYKNYRSYVYRITPPAVPYVGLYLRDLLFIDEGTSDFLDSEKTLVNYQKRRLVGNILLDVEKWKRMSYNLQVEPTISTWLLELPDVGGESLYELSLAAEAKISSGPASPKPPV